MSPTEDQMLDHVWSKIRHYAVEHGLTHADIEAIFNTGLSATYRAMKQRESVSAALLSEADRPC